MITHAQRTAIFGSFSFSPAPRPGNPEAVRIDPAWASQNLVSVRISQLARTVTVHRLARLPILALWAAWERKGLIQHIHSWNGSWACRFKRQNGTEDERAKKCAILGAAALSNHAFGSAFDVNAQELPLGAFVPADHPFRTELAPIARDMGWEWGGDYKVRPDGMHFELARF